MIYSDVYFSDELSDKELASICGDDGNVQWQKIISLADGANGIDYAASYIYPDWMRSSHMTPVTFNIENKGLIHMKSYDGAFLIFAALGKIFATHKVSVYYQSQGASVVSVCSHELIYEYGSLVFAARGHSLLLEGSYDSGTDTLPEYEDTDAYKKALSIAESDAKKWFEQGSRENIEGTYSTSYYTRGTYGSNDKESIDSLNEYYKKLANVYSYGKGTYQQWLQKIKDCKYAEVYELLQEGFSDEYATEELCLKAVAKDKSESMPPLLQFLPTSARTLKVCLKAVSKNTFSIDDVPKEIMTKELCLAYLKGTLKQRNRDSISGNLFPENFWDDESFCIDAVTVNSAVMDGMPEKAKTPNVYKAVGQPEKYN
jgi:hypothetical protein